MFFKQKKYIASLFTRCYYLSWHAVFLCYAIFLLLLSGCGNLSYLSQAAAGHFRVMGTRVPIEKILQHNRLNSESQKKPSLVEEKLRFDEEKLRKLRLALEVREFASAELGLPRNKSYTLFSEIKDEYLGWNVYATPRFSVEPITWCFPIAGCVVYRGYFSKEKALRFAKKLEDEGNDVYVSPISAYSTLGWYNDPVLNSHLRLSDVHLAGLIIHELAHQQLYIKGDSRFSESFAVTVERAGVLRWLKSSGRDSLMAEAVKMWEHEDLYHAKMLAARSKLSEIYTSYNKDNHTFQNPDAPYNYTEEQKQVMQQKKDSLLLEFTKEFGPARFGKINNAFFVPANTYYSLVPQFQRLLDSLGGDFAKFYKEAKRTGVLLSQ